MFSFGRTAAITLFALLALTLPGRAQQPGPRLPCGTAPLPPFPAGGTPVIQAWTAADLPPDWTPPACTGWRRAGAKMLVALAASFPHAGSSEELLARFGAVSTTRGMRYWSASDKQWRVLITEAGALAGPSGSAARRPDFAAAELNSGAELFFYERDGRSSGEVTYRLRLLESSADRILLAVENATPVKYMLFTLFAAGDMQLVYVLQRLGPDRWGYYSLMRAGAQASAMASGHAASYMNRAQALYRHFVGLPTDQEPPAAR